MKGTKNTIKIKKSDHTGHDYSMLTTGAGGCCDCGDPESWDAKGFCSDHPGPSTARAQTLIPISTETAARATAVLNWVVNFAVDALSSRNNVFLFVRSSAAGYAALPLEDESAVISPSAEHSCEYGLEDVRLHQRFFRSERGGGGCSGEDQYFVFLHNSESISFGTAISAVCEALAVTKDQALPLVNLVDHEDFSLVFAGGLSVCKAVSNVCI